jgi:hypothetical protein
MEKAVFIGDGRLLEVAVSELDCIGDDKGAGDRVHDLEAAVVEHGRANAEAFLAAEVP